jgi:hypothetical protein
MQRTKNNPEGQTLYKPGDLVLFHYPERQYMLQPLLRGPFKVISQYKNDVELRNIIRGKIMKLHVSRLKIFHGTKQEAIKVAQLDNDEYEIDKLLAYKGDPLHRKRMDFLDLNSILRRCGIVVTLKSRSVQYYSIRDFLQSES